jgi:type IV pilus assembly protein PilY1
MKTSTRTLALIALLLGLAAAPATFAQTLLTEDFTGTTSSASGGVGNWLFFNGACLTAGTSTVLTSPATSIPACTTVLNSYYKHTQDSDQYLTGGDAGFLGSNMQPSSPFQQVPDTSNADGTGLGALRFTNGRPYGNQQRGAIVSTNAYSTGAGIQVTFKTVTYGGTGADGISFYLMDGCVPVAGANMPGACAPTAIYPAGAANVPAIGATGGSLAFSCSNTNGPTSGQGVTYDGLTGAYLGLGIDEYGNFLNQGDNSGSGFGFVPGRIGLRGGGAISWPALNNAYHTAPPNSNMPYYPTSLKGSCGSGTYDSVTNTCGVCPATSTATSTSGSTTTTAVTTSIYGSGICNNTVISTAVTTTDSGCVSSGFALTTLAGNPICEKCSSGAYVAVTDGSNPNGICSFTPKTTTPSFTCNSGQSSDNISGTKYCIKSSALSTNHNFTTTSTSGVTTTTNTSGSSAVTLPYDQIAVQKTCSTGKLWNYATANAPTDAGTATLPGDTNSPNANNTAGILDYPAIPGANLTLLPANPLFNGSATTRGGTNGAVPIFYNLKITTDGYLSLSFAWNGGTYLPVISNQKITNANGPVPNFVRFGFAGSTGGATNIHEILCFKSASATQSGSSAGVNEKQSAKVDTGTFAYFAFYDPNNWVGRVTANQLFTDTTTGNVSLASTPTWDASCVLTGLLDASQTCAATGVAGPVLPAPLTGRTILTYNPGTSTTAGSGVSFEWASLSTDQQNALTQGDATSSQYRFNYLRGDRSNEVKSDGTCTGGAPVCFRARTSLLGDIVDSSPTWVGPPQSPYTATWHDKLYATATVPESSGGQTYLQYVSAEQTRPNVVYVGSNDGMMHGFRSGSSNSDGTFNPANNDGQEVLAYMPGALLSSASTGGNCASLGSTGSVVQNIHGVTPAYPSPPATATQPACVTTTLDFSNIHYGHNFFVDATPGTGDLYYPASSTAPASWHTWLVGGLGAGGAAIYALDVSNPTAGNFTEGNASSLVVGEWTPQTISCVTSGCGTNMGNTFGTPIIRRLHDGNWAVIFGNGFGSATGDAGIFVMTIDHTNGTKSFYYLSTGVTGGTAKNNGIGYVTSADLDGDHVTDYIYAGDLLGNVWRFDLTGSSESTWVSTAPAELFSVPGQSITTAVTVSAGATPAGANTIMIAFGTGKRTQFTNAAMVQYAPTGGLFGVWDWNMSNWNSRSTVQYASLTPTAAGLTGPLTTSNLQTRTFTLNADGVTRDILNTTAICWAGSSCTATAQYGWFVGLYGAQEQIVFNPQLLQGAFTVNSVVPANNQALACTTNLDAGFTYALSVLTGNVVPNFFVSFHDTQAAGTQTNSVGTSFPVTSATGSLWLVSQTVNNQPLLTQVNPGATAKGRRLTWVQLR